MCDWKGSPLVQFDTLLTEVLSAARNNRFLSTSTYLTEEGLEKYE